MSSLKVPASQSHAAFHGMKASRVAEESDDDDEGHDEDASIPNQQNLDLNSRGVNPENMTDATKDSSRRNRRDGQRPAKRSPRRAKRQLGPPCKRIWSRCGAVCLSLIGIVIGGMVTQVFLSDGTANPFSGSSTFERQSTQPNLQTPPPATPAVLPSPQPLPTQPTPSPPPPLLPPSPWPPPPPWPQPPPPVTPSPSPSPGPPPLHAPTPPPVASFIDGLNQRFRDGGKTGPLVDAGVMCVL